MPNAPDEPVFRSAAEVIAYVGTKDSTVSLGKFVEALNTAADEQEEYDKRGKNKQKRQRVKDALRDFDPDDDLYLDMD